MIKSLKNILKNPTISSEWKEADEIVPHVWLGCVTENEHAEWRDITEVICISKEPYADLVREGFKDAPNLDTTVFKIASDTEGEMMSIFSDICDAIDGTVDDGHGVLVWDVGGGVAAMAAYVMRKLKVSLPEAMTVITRARLKRAKRTLLPSQRIIDMLHNEEYQKQLDVWQACGYDVVENSVLNPDEPREKWIVERVAWDTEIREEEKNKKKKKKKKKNRDDVRAMTESVEEELPLISEQPHRLSTIDEVEEEVRRLSIISLEEDEGTERQGWTLPEFPRWMP